MIRDERLNSAADVRRAVREYERQRACERPARINGPESPLGVILLVFAAIGVMATVYYALAGIGALIGV